MEVEGGARRSAWGGQRVGGDERALEDRSNWIRASVAFVGFKEPPALSHAALLTPASAPMVLTAFKALAAPIYDVTFRAFVKLIELNVVPDFIIRTGVRALLQTRLDLVRLSRRRHAPRTASTQLNTRRLQTLITRHGRRSSRAAPSCLIAAD